METTLQRIKKYIDLKGITNQCFEKTIGFSNGAFGTQLKNNKTIGVDKLENILIAYPELNVEWLLTGKGEMLKENSIVKPIDNESIGFKEVAQSRLEVIEALKKIIAFQDKEIARLENLISELKYTVSGNPIVYSNVAEPPPELIKKPLKKEGKEY